MCELFVTVGVTIIMTVVASAMTAAELGPATTLAALE
jgi:hypothetical protein